MDFLYTLDELEEKYFRANILFCTAIYLLTVQFVKHNYKPRPCRSFRDYLEQDLKGLLIWMFIYPEKLIMFLFYIVSLVSLSEFMNLIHNYQNVVYGTTGNRTFAAFEHLMEA